MKITIQIEIIGKYEVATVCVNGPMVGRIVSDATSSMAMTVSGEVIGRYETFGAALDSLRGGGR